ncbi:amidase family protein [Paraburkholderia oxyphila]|uniref:amidase family protein n=1 Tax=Paraburkholderia oxyphila TaxID=614212 RepID=UPI00048898D7|nr:amidase family protein [Paraburkholderia oxyphila]
MFPDPDLADAEDVFRIELAWMIGTLVQQLDARSQAMLKPEIEDECRLHRSLSAADLGRMFVRKSALFQRMREFMNQHSFYVLPATQMLPFDAGLRWPESFMGQAHTSYIDWMRICWYLSSTESPVLAVPCGFSATGLPIGMQIAGRYRDDWGVLQLGHAYEQAAAHRHARPSVIDA